MELRTAFAVMRKIGMRRGRVSEKVGIYRDSTLIQCDIAREADN